MKCEEYIELLSEYADGELSPEKTAQVEAHLACCEKCRNYLDQLCALKLEMADMSEPVPQELHNRVMQAVSAEKNKKVIKIPFYRKKVFGWAIAACFMIAVIGAFVPQIDNNIEKEGAMYDARSYSEAAEDSNSMKGTADVPLDFEPSAPEAPGESMDVSKEDAPTCQDPAGISYIFRGLGAIPEDLVKYAPQYGDGEIYIFCEDVAQINEIVKLLSNGDFKQADCTVLSEKAIGILGSSDKVIIIVLD